MNENSPNQPSEITTAHHEAAHAVVSYLFLGDGGSLSIVSSHGTAGRNNNQIADSSCEADLESEILSLYAGGHAQRRVDPASGTDGCWQDDELAMEILLRCDWQSREDEFRARSLSLVNEHWQTIDAVALELLNRKVLDETEVSFIIEGDLESLLHYRQAFVDRLT